MEIVRIPTVAPAWRRGVMAFSTLGMACIASCALGVLVPAFAVRAEPVVGHCTMMAGAGHAVCRVPRAPIATPPAGAFVSAPDRIGFADFAGGYSIYRLISATDEQRRCRLQPTCSLFAARAARRFGLLQGLLMGFARAQMSHSDQGGLLPRAIASDGRFIYLDPVERWIHGAP